MSTSAVTSGAGAVGSAVSSSGAALVNISGLASGVDDNAIIQAMLSADRAPMTALTQTQWKVQAQQTQLQSIQGRLQSLSLSTSDISSPTLFATSQAVSSSDPTKMTATTTAGAGVGGYQVAVSQLANSAQRTFSFTTPAAADTITIDGHQTALAAGASIQDLVTAINSDSQATVYAAATSAGTVVFSNRTTGNTGTSFIQVVDPSGTTLVEQTALAKQGQNAAFTVDGVAGTSSTNTVTNAIAGVTLNLNGVTTTSGPVTVNVSAPAPSVSSIQSTLQAFVSAYNSTIDQIAGQVSQKPVQNPVSQSDFSQGSLYADVGLSQLASHMRTMMYTPDATLPAGMASLADIGITTGAPTGSAPTSANTLAGHLTIDSAKLAAAIQSNPNGVKAILRSVSQNFKSMVDGQGGPGGTLDARIAGDGSQLSAMTSQMATLQEMLNSHQAALQARFTAMETAISNSQQQGAWLTAQISRLP